MPHIIVLGAGITGITTAYALLRKGHQVTVVDRHRYAAMETSYANGGQLSASNAEVWNNWGTVAKGIKWMFTKDAPLLMNPSPDWHKYSWITEFAGKIPKYQQNTIDTAKLAIAAREHLFEIADREKIEFDLERRGILHVYYDKTSFEHAESVNALLNKGGLDRRPVAPSEIQSIEPNIRGEFYGGFFTPSDSTGDIHKFTSGLAKACSRLGANLLLDAEVTDVRVDRNVRLEWRNPKGGAETTQTLEGDAIVVCAGVGSRKFASMLGDRVNIYPVKGYSITVHLDDERSVNGAPWVSLLDDKAKIVTSRLGADRFRVAGTAEFNGMNRDIRADRIAPLVEWVRRLFPEVSTQRVVSWSGLRPMMPNMLPKVGPGSKPGVYYNTGHGHLGWTLSCATAALVAEQISGGPAQLKKSA